MPGKLGTAGLAVVLTAGLFALAACGSGGKKESLTFSTATTTTLTNPTPGETVRCRGLHARIPPQGEGVAHSGQGTSSGAKLQLTRRSDGSLTISCTP